MTDAIEMLVAQHREVEELFEAMEGMQVASLADPIGGELQRRLALTNTIVKKLSQHAAIEELHFYPAAHESLERGEALAGRAEQEQQHVKDLLQRLDGMSPDNLDFDELLREAIADVRAHVAYEEGELFPQMRAALGPDRLGEIGERMAKAMRLAPTHPHAHTPVNKLTAVTGGLMDRARDVMERKRTV